MFCSVEKSLNNIFFTELYCYSIAIYKTRIL